MQSAFTVHCIAWQSGAPLLLEARTEAYMFDLLNSSEILPDEMDLQSRHALVLSKNGRAIGCARITPDGKIERMAVLPHEYKIQIEAALIEILIDYQHQTGTNNPVVEAAKRKPYPTQIPS